MKEITATVNDDVYSSILTNIGREGMDNVAQPSVIVGADGSGKTRLIHRLADGIGILKPFAPVLVEGMTLFSTDDIWKRCVSKLDGEFGQAAFDDILEWQNCNSRRVVLLIDNIQYYFSRTDNTEHYNLRGKTSRAGSPIIIATSDKVLRAFTDYDEAFFEGFRIHYLKTLSNSEISGLVGDDHVMPRLAHLMSFMPGTIRSLSIALRIVGDSDDGEGDESALVRCFAPVCQLRYDKYPMQVQRILLALAGMKSGADLQDIRNATGQDNGRISPYLKLMLDEGVINKTALTPRGGIYSIADPLFGLWLRKVMD